MKISTLFVMIILASSPLLVVIPAAASEYTLDVFGNANMDETVDETDIAYVEGIIDGTNEVTELADANYDGNIDAQDDGLHRSDGEDHGGVGRQPNRDRLRKPHGNRLLACKGSGRASYQSMS